MSSAAASSFVEVRCTLPIHLHPSRLGQVRQGVEEQINAMLMTYVSDLGGVLLSYSELTLSSSPSTNPLQAGFIFQERSYVHFSVEIKALTWRVAAGQRYEGVVNAVAGDHLAMLLHGVFTATVPLSGAQVPKGWSFDAEKERWIDASLYKGEAAAEAGSDDDEAGVKEEEAGKKLSKKELKKLERRKLRDVMLAATGRGPKSAARPAPGVITRGVHLRFECVSVQHSDEYFKLAGSLVPRRNSAAGRAALGLTGGFTPLAAVAGLGAKAEEAEEEVAADGDFDMSAIAAVTAGAVTPARNNGHAAAAAASSAVKSAPSPLHSSTPAPSAKKEKVHTDKQQAKYLAKQKKMADRLASKAAESEGVANPDETPKKKQKKV